MKPIFQLLSYQNFSKETYSYRLQFIVPKFAVTKSVFSIFVLIADLSKNYKDKDNLKKSFIDVYFRLDYE